MSTVTNKIASEEVAKWLEYKKVSSKKQEQNSDSVETLVSAIEDGDLYLDEKNNLIQKLKFPENLGIVTELKYKPRVSVSELKSATDGIKATDAEGRIAAYAAAICDQPRTLMLKLDTEDNRIAQAITVFFL